MKRISPQSFTHVLAFSLIAVVHLPGLAVAEGALAIGLPNDVAKEGIALGWNTNSPTSSFHDQCVAGAEDPDPGTPGVGWAVAADKKTAQQRALAMCKAKSPPVR